MKTKLLLFAAVLITSITFSGTTTNLVEKVKLAKKDIYVYPSIFRFTFKFR